MSEYAYDIVLSAPLGQRRGTMEVSVSGKKIEGVFDIMGNRDPFSGELKEDGNCRLQGRLVTLVRTIEYTANGHFDRDAVDLTLQGRRSRLGISGTARRGEEER